MAEPTSKDTLAAELADARTRMTGLARALRYELRIVPRVKANIERNQLAWFSGAALLGLILASLCSPRERVEVKVRAPRSDSAPAAAGKTAFALAIVKIAFDFARPILLRYLTDRLRGHRPAR